MGEGPWQITNIQVSSCNELILKPSGQPTAVPAHRDQDSFHKTLSHFRLATSYDTPSQYKNTLFYSFKQMLMVVYYISV